MIPLNKLLCPYEKKEVDNVYYIFFLHRHPDIQKRIQAELDDVVGRGRLPSLTDR